MIKPFNEITSGDISISPFDANPIPDYEAPENFPNCCERHKGVLEQAQSWFATFPNCCDQHKAMAKKYWFNYWLKENNYSGTAIANKIVRQLSYTEHIISKMIVTENWFKYITDYIDYNVSSFGQPAIGLHIYLGEVKHYIRETTELPEIKRKNLIDFIEKEYYAAPKEGKTKIDFNILFNIYQDWVKAFPFELNSYFGNLKQQYEQQLPIIDGTPEVNTFTGIAKAKIVTKEKLFQVLINLTDNLLQQINGITLYEQGLVTDTNKIKLELVIAQRKRKLNEGYKYNSPDETTQYKKMIQYWFNDEKKFFDEITPLIKVIAPEQAEKKEVKKYDESFSFETDEPVTELYLKIKDRISRDKNKCENFKGIKIYTPILSYLFHSSSLKVKRIDTTQYYPSFEQKEINGREYFNSYEEGYKQGVSYFENSFNPSYLYSENSKAMISDIRSNYFGDENSSPPKTGWNYVKKTIPLTLSHEIIKEYGYYSGIVTKVDELAEKHAGIFYLLQKDDSTTDSKINPESSLKSIWLPEAKISIKDFLKLGVDNGLWDEDYRLITQRGSLYGTGKTLLGCLSIALRGYAISTNTDYKVIGEIFCTVFHVNKNEATKEPYKLFSTGKPKITYQLKRTFGIK